MTLFHAMVQEYILEKPSNLTLQKLLSLQQIFANDSYLLRSLRWLQVLGIQGW